MAVDSARLSTGFMTMFKKILAKLRPAPGLQMSKNEAVLNSPFFVTEDIKAVHEYFLACSTELENVSESDNLLHGRCFVCQGNVDFGVKLTPDGSPVNWRETLVCPKCKLINRWRACLHLFEEICTPDLQDPIFLTETLSPVFQQLSSQFPQLCASEYLPQFELGSLVPTHSQLVRNEDVTQLTFEDGSFKTVLSFDVLEHVPDYIAALREFYRVLSDDGQLVLSVPFSFRQETLVRAEVGPTGTINHLLEPCYHGDPLSAQGVLSYYDFGMELLDEMKLAGFQQTFLVCYCSRQWGYLGGNVAFVGRKL